MICISNRGLAGGLALHAAAGPVLAAGAIRRGGQRRWLRMASAAAPSAGRAPAPAAGVRCTWTSTPAILVHSASGLRLIDWEYAGDGDIALELAAVWVARTERAPAAGHVSVRHARGGSSDAQLLWRQVVLWRPWVLLLMAGWYEMRWRQSGDRQFITLADETWCQLDNERKG